MGKISLFQINGRILLISLFLIVVIFKLNFLKTGFWYDEWHTFFWSNPDFLLLENLNILVENSVTPPLYFLITAFFHKLFGYSPEAGRLLSIIFNSLSFLILYFFLKQNFSKKISFFILLFFLLNYSIILYSIELRFYSFYIFVTLINIYFFFNIIYKYNNQNLFKYLFVSLVSFSSNYFLAPIILIQFAFLFIKKNFFFYYGVCFIIIFLLLNYSHLTYILELNSLRVWGVINFSFFLGYYFNIFFGSKIFGALVLLTILTIFLIKFKKIKTDKNFLILTSFIASTYIFFILYSLILTPVLRPRYFLHIVPLILCIFVILIFKINNIKIRNIILIFFTILHFIKLAFFSLPFEKPDTDKLIKILQKQNIPIIIEKFELEFLNQNKQISDISPGNYKQLYFINHFINLYFLKKFNLNFIEINQLNNVNIFLDICENNPDYQTSIQGDNANCLKNKYSKNNFSVLKRYKTKDFIVNKYQKRLK